MALFIVEAVTNAMKYAFDYEGGQISVYLYAEGENTILDVVDDGRGLEETEETSNSDGLGSKLMKAFARQLRSEMRVESVAGKGYRVSLVLPPETVHVDNRVDY